MSLILIKHLILALCNILVAQALAQASLDPVLLGWLRMMIASTALFAYLRYAGIRYEVSGDDAVVLKQLAVILTCGILTYVMAIRLTSGR